MRSGWRAASRGLCVIAVASSCAVAPSRARAQAAGAGARSSTTAVVVRGRAGVWLDPTSTTSRLDREALDRARVEGSSLGDLVDRLPGARVLDDGGPLHAQRLTVRGGSGAQAQLVVDGLPLSSPFATGLDVGVVAPEMIARASLVRGGAGAILGDGALTGALVLETRTPGEQAPWTANVRGGTLDRLGVGATVATRAVAVSADVERTSGRFEYLSRLAGLPDVVRVRENNDASRGRASARSAIPVGGGRLDVLVGGATREGGLPGFETQADRDAREARTTGLARVSWRRALGRETPAVEPIQRLDDPRGRAAGGTVELAAQAHVLDLAFADDDERSRTTFVAATGEGTATWALEIHRLRVSAGGGLESSRSTQHGSPSRGRAHVLVADTLVLGELQVLGALRATVVGGSGLVVLPRVGLSWAVDEALTLGLGGGRSFRAPAIDELYHPITRGFAGNPALRPETAWEVEASARLAAGGIVEVGLAGFVRRLEDTIVYVNQNAFVVRPENLDGATVAGAELEVAARAELGAISLELTGAASALVSALDASDAPLPTAPPLAGDLEARASWWPDASVALAVYTRVGATASTTANVAGTIPVDVYARWDAGLSAMWGGRWSVALEVTNLIDDRSLESVFKLPLPGRALLATARVEAW